MKIEEQLEKVAIGRWLNQHLTPCAAALVLVGCASPVAHHGRQLAVMQSEQQRQHILVAWSANHTNENVKFYVIYKSTNLIEFRFLAMTTNIDFILSATNQMGIFIVTAVNDGGESTNRPGIVVP